MLHNEKTEGSNITCISLDDGLVFVDCSLFTEISQQFRSDMEKRFNKKTIALILTHAHTDHFFGMGSFSDVNVFAASKSKAYFNFQLKINFKENLKVYEGIFPRFEEALKTSKLSTPNIWIDSTCQIGNIENYIIFSHTGGHSIGSSFVYYPKEKVIIAGDNVQVDYHPYFGDKTGNIYTWINTLNYWETLEVDRICPGHGKVIDKNYLIKTREYFENLTSKLETFKTQNLTIEQVINHKELPKGYWSADLVKPNWFNYSLAFIYKNIDTFKQTVK